MRKEKVLLYGIYLAGLLGVVVFVVSKSEYLVIKATEERRGDLFKFARVGLFRQEMPMLQTEIQPRNLDSLGADVYAFGDSFFETCYGHKMFTEQLSEHLGQSVYYIDTRVNPRYSNPIYYFKTHSIDHSKKRTVLVECVERYLIRCFANPADYNYADPRIETSKPVSDELVERWLTETEKNYEYLLTHSWMTRPLVEVRNSMLFSVFGMISPMTPVYSTNPPFLFYCEEITPELNTSFYYKHTDSIIAVVAHNIEIVANTLRSRYNAELVFLPAPNKYTIYHRYINNDIYDDFLPRLCAQLKQRGIKVVNLYPKFMAALDLLYHPTDTHWNKNGVSLAVTETLSEFGTDSGTYVALDGK